MPMNATALEVDGSTDVGRSQMGRPIAGGPGSLPPSVRRGRRLTPDANAGKMGTVGEKCRLILLTPPIRFTVAGESPVGWWG